MLHLVTDGSGLPLAVALSAGQAHESRYVEPVLDAVCISRGAPDARGAVHERWPVTRATAMDTSATGSGDTASGQ